MGTRKSFLKGWVNYLIIVAIYGVVGGYLNFANLNSTFATTPLETWCLSVSGTYSASTCTLTADPPPLTAALFMSDDETLDCANYHLKATTSGTETTNCVRSDGFDISECTAPTPTSIPSSPSVAILLNEVTGVTIKNCKLDDNTTGKFDFGIVVWNSGDVETESIPNQNEISNNTIKTLYQGVEVVASDNVLISSNNITTKSSASAPILVAQDSDYVEVENNNVTGSTASLSAALATTVSINHGTCVAGFCSGNSAPCVATANCTSATFQTHPAFRLAPLVPGGRDTDAETIRLEGIMFDAINPAPSAPTNDEISNPFPPPLNGCVGGSGTASDGCVGGTSLISPRVAGAKREHNEITGNVVNLVDMLPPILPIGSYFPGGIIVGTDEKGAVVKNNKVIGGFFGTRDGAYGILGPGNCVSGKCTGTPSVHCTTQANCDALADTRDKWPTDDLFENNTTLNQRGFGVTSQEAVGAILKGNYISSNGGLFNGPLFLRGRGGAEDSTVTRNIVINSLSSVADMVISPGGAVNLFPDPLGTQLYFGAKVYLNDFVTELTTSVPRVTSASVTRAVVANGVNAALLPLPSGKTGYCLQNPSISCTANAGCAGINLGVCDLVPAKTVCANNLSRICSTASDCISSQALGVCGGNGSFPGKCSGNTAISCTTQADCNDAGACGPTTRGVCHNDTARVCTANANCTIAGTCVAYIYPTDLTVGVCSGDLSTPCSRLAGGRDDSATPTVNESIEQCADLGLGTCINRQGNYWGRDCSGSDGFIEFDSTNTLACNVSSTCTDSGVRDVIDSHPYGERVGVMQTDKGPCVAGFCSVGSAACVTDANCITYAYRPDPPPPNICVAVDQCYTGTCNPAAMSCPNPGPSTCSTADSCPDGSTIANGTSCDDGNACSQTDSCQNGVCTGSNPVICTALDQCHNAGTCSGGVCSNPNKTDGTSCDDTDACSQTDTCQSGVCTGSNPVICTASDQCHDVGTCSGGVCSNPNKTDGTACNDTNVCTTGDACTSGSCGGSALSCNSSSFCNPNDANFNAMLACLCPPQTAPQTTTLNHAYYVSCVAQVTNHLKSRGCLTGNQKSQIQTVAAKSSYVATSANPCP